MKSSSGMRTYPFTVTFDPGERLFVVRMDGKVIGSHKGRGRADRIGFDATAVLAASRRPATRAAKFP